MLIFSLYFSTSPRCRLWSRFCSGWSVFLLAFFLLEEKSLTVRASIEFLQERGYMRRLLLRCFFSQIFLPPLFFLVSFFLYVRFWGSLPVAFWMVSASRFFLARWISLILFMLLHGEGNKRRCTALQVLLALCWSSFFAEIRRNVKASLTSRLCSLFYLLTHI
jgi:hypothetical protein